MSSHPQPDPSETAAAAEAEDAAAQQLAAYLEEHNSDAEEEDAEELDAEEQGAEEAAAAEEEADIAQQEFNNFVFLEDEDLELQRELMAAAGSAPAKHEKAAHAFFASGRSLFKNTQNIEKKPWQSKSLEAREKAQQEAAAARERAQAEVQRRTDEDVLKRSGPAGSQPMMDALSGDVGATAALLQCLDIAELASMCCVCSSWRRWVTQPTVSFEPAVGSASSSNRRLARAVRPREFSLLHKSALARRYLSVLEFALNQDGLEESDPIIDFSPLSLLPALRVLAINSKSHWRDSSLLYSAEEISGVKKCTTLTYLSLGNWICALNAVPSFRQLVDGWTAAALEAKRPLAIRQIHLESTQIHEGVLEQLLRLPTLTIVEPLEWTFDVKASQIAAIPQWTELQRFCFNLRHRDHGAVFPPRPWADELIPALVQCHQLTHVNIDCGHTLLSAARLEQLCALPLLAQLRLFHARLESLDALALCPRLVALEVGWCLMADQRSVLLALPAMAALADLFLFEQRWAEGQGGEKADTYDIVPPAELASRKQKLLERMPMLASDRVRGYCFHHSLE